MQINLRVIKRGYNPTPQSSISVLLVIPARGLYLRFNKKLMLLLNTNHISLSVMHDAMLPSARFGGKTQKGQSLVSFNRHPFDI